jgi:hypothetical protein
MLGRESAPDEGRSLKIYQAEIVYWTRTGEFISYFNQKVATSTGGMHLQIENCIVALSEEAVASSVWQRCAIRR